MSSDSENHPVRPLGRPLTVLKPSDVVKAASGLLRTLSTIAEVLDVDRRTLNAAMERDPTLQAAYDRGRASRSVWLEEQIDKQIIENPKSSTLLLLAGANQPASAGGLGWTRGDVTKIEGKLEVVVIHEIIDSKKYHADKKTGRPHHGVEKD